MSLILQTDSDIIATETVMARGSHEPSASDMLMSYDSGHIWNAMKAKLLFSQWMIMAGMMLLVRIVSHPKMPSVMNSVMFMRNDNDDINLLKRNIWVSPPSFLVLVWLAVCMACEGRGMPWLVVAKLIFSFHIPKRSLVFFQPT